MCERACEAVHERPCEAVRERPCEAVRERPCEAVRERPCEAVHERPCSLLIGSDRSHDKLCEAVRGHVRPCSPDWLGQISNPMRGARPHTASHGLPNSASQTYKIHRKQ